MSNQRLSFREAAELIYGTKSPTALQLEKIALRLDRGALQGSRRGNWVTADSVAAYIAAKTEQQRLAATEQPQGGRSVGREARKKLPPIYRHSLQDYVAAVLRRREPDHASPGFRRAVLGGQCAVVLFPLIVVVMIYATATAPPPEHAAVQRWLEREHSDYQIVQWFPPGGEGGPVSRVRLQYKYFTPTRKPILTDREFIVEDGEVITVAQAED